MLRFYVDCFPDEEDTLLYHFYYKKIKQKVNDNKV